MLALLKTMQTPPTPFSREAFTQLIAQLETLKDENAKENSSSMGKTLEWDEETGKVLLTVRNFPYLSVNVSVMTTPLWEEYMDNRERQGLPYTDMFCYDGCEDTFIFRVDSQAKCDIALREIRVLNSVRLNWCQLKTDRHLVLAMGAHTRLGAASPLALLDADTREAIAHMM